MNDAQPILFFSDTHFGAHGPTQEQTKIERFVSLLDHARRIGAEVFFLGDLFDFWFEYRHWMPKIAVEIPAAIRAFTAQGGQFHLIVGNHDCWTEDYFSRHLGAHLYRDDLIVVRQGLRILISHGDGKAPSDSGYRRWRKILRFRPNVLLYRLWPADWAYRTARHFSGRSRDRHAHPSPDFVAEYERVTADLVNSGFDAVIMGHVHQAWVKRTGKGWSINTGEFFERFSYVVLENGVFRLEEWKPQERGDGSPQNA